MEKYVIYYRVSSQKQGRSGLGLEAQMDFVNTFLRGDRSQVLCEFTEIESGKKSNRPELIKALDLCQRSKAVLLVAKLDRLSRDLNFITSLQKAKIDFKCADMPEANSLTIHIIGAMAEYERGLISIRTKDALAQAKKRGIKLGAHIPNVLKGLKNGKKRGHIHFQEKAQSFAESVRPIIYPLREAKFTQREIVDHLNKCEVKTHRGKNWSLIQLQRVMKRLELT